MGPQERPLRRGWTTGTCATAAAKAAYAALLTGEFPDPVEVTLPRGERVSFALAVNRREEDCATAGVVKDAGDDPDVTHGALVLATVFIGGYTWSVAQEARRLRDAVTATQLALARVQRISAVGGVFEAVERLHFRKRKVRREDLGQPAQSLIEPFQHHGPEPARQIGSRQLEQRTDPVNVQPR